MHGRAAGAARKRALRLKNYPQRAAFMFCEALSSWRRGPQAQDEWAEEVASLLGAATLTARKSLVRGNFKTHTPGAFYEAASAGTG